MHVVEHITYDFHGPFSYGTRPIPVGPYQITDMRVTEHGQELTSVGAPYNLQWFFDAEDEQRTFDIEYTVLGAADGRARRRRAVLEVGRRAAPEDRAGHGHGSPYRPVRATCGPGATASSPGSVGARATR